MLKEAALIRSPWSPSGRSPDIRKCRWTEGGGYGKEIYRGENGINNMRDWREEIRNWPELGDVLKRTVWWPSGQVGTDNAVLDAYSL
jgi:hypothetical protein